MVIWNSVFYAGISEKEDNFITYSKNSNIFYF